MKIMIPLSIALFFCFAVSTAQTVTTILGGTPDDGIAVDDSGNIYASNFTGDSVFKFTADGTVTSFITGLDTPNGLAFDADGNLLVCDWNANTIYKYNIDGVLLDSYGASGNPSGLIQSFDGSAMIFTEYSGNKLNYLAADGTVSPLSDASELNGPVGLAYDESGTLYVGNYNNREIYKVETNGDLEYVAQLPATGALPNLGFITYAQGYLWGTILGTNKIYKINPNATDDYEVFAGSTQGNEDGDITTATFNRPNGILFNAAEDEMYVTDFGSKNLRIVSDLQLSVQDNAVKKNSLRVLVNKSLNEIIVDLQIDDVSMLSLRIYDLGGRPIYISNEHHAEGLFSKQINTANWAKGIYIVEVVVGNNTLTKKFVRL